MKNSRDLRKGDFVTIKEMFYKSDSDIPVGFEKSHYSKNDFKNFNKFRGKVAIVTNVIKGKWINQHDIKIIENDFEFKNIFKDTIQLIDLTCIDKIK